MTIYRYKNKEEANGRPISEQGLCGIFAMSLAVNKPVQTVFNAYRKYFRMSKEWRGRTRTENYATFLTNKYKRKVRYIINEYEGSKMSLKKFIDEHTARDKSYIISYRGHAMFIHNKTCYDQSSIVEYKSIGKRDSFERESYYGNTYVQYYGGQKNGIVKYAIEVTNSLFKPSRVEREQI
jgi:hypothetical protein